ncbi:DUF3679 domain-containing protein [Ammoniphilus resinae]|uniref:PurR-regulated permease PerM n=1 Tax=Ammoniphilus resinae TaxID=861532 RepID=A0ABS4GJS9_9BACL|nr:DUF3679 domain-containing protein [Ammoniphilus resinae]MBP1930504.1 putative PurR-regulated permease PerM [Ammoniphilus resinae]
MIWRIKFFGFVLFMICFVLGGIQLAENGTRRLDGFENGPAQSFHIARVDQGKLEMTVLGQQYYINGVDRATDQGQAASNWISSIGNSVGDWISTSTNNMAKWLFK